MIKKIILQNFQSHKFSELEFSENVNVVLGSSDAGKTAILRALRWVAFHKPTGDEMRSHWGGKTQVSVVTDNCTVTKSKDKEQEYILGDTHFKAFGTEVPKEIKDALNLDGVNLQLQLDQPFLLSETSGKVAEHWNSIAHLEVIDRATSNINSAIREITSDIKYSEGQEKTLQESLEKFSYLPAFEKEVEVLENLEKQKEVLVDQRNKLDVNIGRLIDINEDLKEVSRILVIEKPVNDLLDLITLRTEKERDADKLNNFLTRFKEVQSKLASQTAVLAVEKPVNDLLGLYKEKETAVKQRESLNKAITNLRNIQVNLNKGKANHDSLHLQFEKNMGSVCILCGQNIKNHK